MLKFCPNCGFHLAGGEEFCPNCGFRLSGITDVTEKSTPVEVPAEKPQPAPATPTPEKTSPTAIAPKKKTKKKWLALSGGLLVILAGCAAVFFLFFHDEKLTGNYSSTINFLGTEMTETFKFSGDKVTQLSEGKKVNSGKYTISKGILSIKFGEATLSANLKKDKEAFTIKSGSGLSSILKGLTYTKNGASTTKKSSAKKTATATAAETNTIKNHVRGTYKLSKHRLLIATGKNTFSAKIDEQEKTLSLSASEVPKFVATILDTKSVADTDTKDTTTDSTDAATTDSSSAAQEALNGKYTIKGDKLTLTLGDYQVVLALSPDMKSFVVESDKGFEPEFNFDQIAEGDFSSIEADWINIANVPSPSLDTISDNWEPGDSSDEATLKITKQTMTTNSLTINASGFNTIPTAYQTRKLKDGLEITPTNGDFTRTGDGWTMNFYTRGTYESFIPRNGVTFEYSRDLIAINQRLADHTVKWSFYIRKRDALPTPNKASSTEASNSTVINVKEITQHNFSSIMGEWKNPETGKSFTVTDEVKTVIFRDREETGVILTGEDMMINGFPAVIEAGSTREDGFMQADFGYWDTTTVGATFKPIGLLPIGVKVQWEPDDSDATQDRIAFSIQGAIDDVYYRVK